MKTISGRIGSAFALLLTLSALLAACAPAALRRAPAASATAPVVTAALLPAATLVPTLTVLPTAAPSPLPSLTPTLPPPPTSTPTPTAPPTQTLTPSVTPTDLLRRVTLGGSLSSLRRQGKYVWAAVRLECLDASGRVLAQLDVKALRGSYRLPGATRQVALWIGPELGGAAWRQLWSCPPVDTGKAAITLVIRSLATPTRVRATRKPGPASALPKPTPPAATSTGTAPPAAPIETQIVSLATEQPTQLEPTFPADTLAPTSPPTQEQTLPLPPTPEQTLPLPPTPKETRVAETAIFERPTLPRSPTPEPPPTP